MTACLKRAGLAQQVYEELGEEGAFTAGDLALKS